MGFSCRANSLLLKLNRLQVLRDGLIKHVGSTSMHRRKNGSVGRLSYQDERHPVRLTDNGVRRSPLEQMATVQIVVHALEPDIEAHSTRIAARESVTLPRW